MPMLKRLIISNYALINSLDIEFPDGLNIITGETGAGKSILLGAISLLLGKKADATAIMDSTKNCVVEAEFANDIILRRVISQAGRSRSFLNDEPINMAELTSISHKIIDIHEQHQHLLLSDEDYQLSLIDAFAGNGPLLEEYQSQFNSYNKLSSELSTLKRSLAKYLEQMEYSDFLFKELDSAVLVAGELEVLELEQERLAKASELKEALYRAASILRNEESSMMQSLKEVGAQVSAYSSLIEGLASLSERVDSCRIELDDIESEFSTLAENVTVSPDRLMMVEERLSLLYKLMKKHNCDTVEKLIEKRDEIDIFFGDTIGIEDKIDRMTQQLSDLETKLNITAQQLSDKRKEASTKLSKLLEDAIRGLEMPYSLFSIALESAETLSLSGKDRIEFLFSANGGNMFNVSKVASGGELSRIMLAIKSIVSKFSSLPTMIFDEIDTGVSGRIADKMGQVIGDMASNMQIFAITHLPQIASKGNAHFLVYKEFDAEGKAVTNIRQLDEQERIMEVARMLSGSELSDAAIENARVLLNNNKYNNK